MDLLIEHIPKAQGSGNNSGVHPCPPELSDESLNAIALKDLSDSEKGLLLRNSGYLFGVRIDGIDGPRRSMRPVANRRPGGPLYILEKNDIITEVITTKNEREANYAHQGWSLAAASTISPWTSSRIANNNQPNPDGVWITKRTVVQRLRFDMSLEDLIPASDLEANISAALAKPTTFEKFQAMYRALHVWGDVVPLEFDVGISLTFTDSEANVSQLSSMGSYNSIHELLATKPARIAKLGGDAHHFEGEDGKWLTQSVPPLQWRLVRIIRTAPTIDLLNNDLRKSLSELYMKRLSYSPPLMQKPMESHQSYDDTRHASKTVSEVTLRTIDRFDRLFVTYLDGGESNHHGTGRSTEKIFLLVNGEYITDMVIWSDKDWIYGLQFVTNSGRCSPHFGGRSGTPTIARDKGGVLVGFSSLVASDNRNLLSRVQGIWRHDLIDVAPKEDDIFSPYFGGARGTPFNDRSVVRNSNSMLLSRVDVRCGSSIDSIQLTYIDDTSGRAVESSTERHGGQGGGQESFVLGSPEYIVTISGRHDNERITQLCFITNLGRISQVFGEGGGREAFNTSAPRDKDGKYMRLQYIIGKSETDLGGIMFAWTPL